MENTFQLNFVHDLSSQLHTISSQILIAISLIILIYLIASILYLLNDIIFFLNIRSSILFNGHRFLISSLGEIIDPWLLVYAKG